MDSGEPTLARTPPSIYAQCADELYPYLYFRAVRDHEIDQVESQRFSGETSPLPERASIGRPRSAYE